MVRSGTPDGAGDQQSLGDLVALAAKDVSQLIRYEISLAKSELRMDARRVGILGALSGFSAVALSLMLVMLCFAYATALLFTEDRSAHCHDASHSGGLGAGHIRSDDVLRPTPALRT